MRNSLISVVLSAAIAAPIATVAPAGAQDLQLRLDRDGPSVTIDRDDEWRRDDWNSDRYSEVRRGCSPERALDKAERMGLRRVHIADVDRRTIEVQGRKRNGERVYVTFARQSRNCAVL
ncbi:MAG: hypothetical protein JNL61_16945 [Rhizobiaceae bacterium]|nr:hypothetical protein [Rhizobiaceae bacterium]